MARRLKAQGFDVIAWNRTQAKAEALKDVRSFVLGSFEAISLDSYKSAESHNVLSTCCVSSQTPFRGCRHSVPTHALPVTQALQCGQVHTPVLTAG